MVLVLINSTLHVNQVNILACLWRNDQDLAISLKQEFYKENYYFLPLSVLQNKKETICDFMFYTFWS